MEIRSESLRWKGKFTYKVITRDDEYAEPIHRRPRGGDEDREPEAGGPDQGDEIIGLVHEGNHQKVTRETRGSSQRAKAGDSGMPAT